MEHRKNRLSVGDFLSLHEMQKTCNLNPLPKTDVSFLLKNKGPISVDSFSDLSTIEYLEKFRKQAAKPGGYRRSIPGGKDETEEEDQDGEEDDDEDEDEEEEPGEFSLSTTITNPKLISHELRQQQRIFLDEKLSVNRLKEDDYSDSECLRLTATQVEDHVLLEEFWDAKEINISNNELKGVQNLWAMPYLRVINGSQNYLESFLEITPPVPVNLKEVNFSQNSIASIVGLQQYWALTNINLSYNELTTVHGFSGLEYLQELDLSHNIIDKIEDLSCPNLRTLHLNSNCLKDVVNLLGCYNLRCLNLQENQIGSIGGLKNLPELTELNLTGNAIEDISEFEHLKPCLNLSRLGILPNPITSLENWRLIVCHTLPQILWLDDIYVEATELREAENLFSPTERKLAYIDHAAILLHRGRQSANVMFDSYVTNKPNPPILLLVGPPRSHCHSLGLFLKQKGVHSTATTIEGSNPKVDIPISFESFLDMRSKGEYLATCQILGRACGFAESQISTAAEKGALLVAAVPLKTAIAIREWNLNPKLVLVLPSAPPAFPEEDDRIESVRRSFVNEDLPPPPHPHHHQSGKRRSKRRSGSQGDVDEPEGDDDDEKLVNFAENLSVLPPVQEQLDPEKLLYSTEDEGNDGARKRSTPQHSILKSPHFELPETEDGGPIQNDDDDDILSDNDEEAKEKRDDGSHVHMTPSKTENLLHLTLDLEKKPHARLKSIAPGMEHYDIDRQKTNSLIEAMKFGMEEEDDEENDGGDTTTATQDPIAPVAFKPGEVPELQTYRTENLNRLGSILMMKSNVDSLNISDILMRLPHGGNVMNVIQTMELSPPPPHSIPAEGEIDPKIVHVPIICSGTIIPEKKEPSYPEIAGESGSAYEFDNVNYEGDYEEWDGEGAEYEEEEVESVEEERQPETKEEEEEEEDDGEGEEEEEEDGNEKPELCTHKDAMTFSILQLKEEYENFHKNNPGFFHIVIDSSNMCESYSTLEEMAIDALLKSKQDLVNSERENKSILRTHGGSNHSSGEARQFFEARMQEVKDATVSWRRGLDIDNMSKASGIFHQRHVSGRDQLPGLLSYPHCTKKLTEHAIPRRPISLKMKKLVDLQEKMGRCVNYKPKPGICPPVYSCDKFP